MRGVPSCQSTVKFLYQNLELLSSAVLTQLKAWSSSTKPRAEQLASKALQRPNIKFVYNQVSLHLYEASSSQVVKIKEPGVNWCQAVRNNNIMTSHNPISPPVRTRNGTTGICNLPRGYAPMRFQPPRSCPNFGFRLHNRTRECHAHLKDRSHVGTGAPPSAAGD